MRGALALVRESRQGGHTLADGMDWLAAVAGAEGHFVRAARLFGAAEAQWRASGGVRYPPDRSAYESDLAVVRAALGEAELAVAWADGQAMTTEAALAYALAETDSTNGAPAAAAPARGPLTPRQQEVAVLVGRGLTNRQIADRLVITERAAAAHVEHILDKLSVGSRAQIAVWASERGILTTRSE